MAWHNYTGAYDPADFVVPPELEKGKSQRVQCYIQAAHYRLLNIVARSGHFPFEERNDVIRWCVQFGLRYIDSLPNEQGLTRSVMSQANMMNRRLQEQVANETHLKWLENVRTVIHGYIGRGEVDAAKEEVAYLLDQTLKMPDEPDRALRWKCKYLDSLRENFQQYLPEWYVNGKELAV